METNSVVFFQKNECPEIQPKPIVAAWKIKNPQNVGNLIRLVDNAGGDELFLLDDENPKRESSIRKTAGLSYSHIKVNSVSSEEFWNMLPEGYIICALETSEGAENLYQTRLPQKVAFLIGSEAHGLPENLLKKCDKRIFIPATGKCKSFNVSHALAIGLFEWVRQKLFLK